MPTLRVRHAVLAILGCLAIACRDPATTQPTAESPSADAQPPATAAAKPTQAQEDFRKTTPAAVAADPSGDAAVPPAVEGFGPAKLLPLTDEQRTAFLAGNADAPIPVEIHYVQSNETRHDLYFDFIAKKGGAYVGVGSDQNFTMMAAQRAEYAFLMDIDYRVVDLQRMYEVVIEAHDTPRALVDAWHSKNEETTRALLDTAFASLDEKLRGRLLRGFATARETVYRHLERVIARTRDGQGSTWLSNPEHYAHIRAMYQTDRVRMMPGNLAGEVSLQTAAAACKALGVPVRVLYMSNAEEYFKYIPAFVASIEALPTDDSSVVLRTIYSKKWVHADLWAYQVQPIDDFRTRISDRKIRSRNPMMRYAEIDGKLDKDTGAEGLTLIALERP